MLCNGTACMEDTLTMVFFQMNIHAFPVLNNLNRFANCNEWHNVPLPGFSSSGIQNAHLDLRILNHPIKYTIAKICDHHLKAIKHQAVSMEASFLETWFCQAWYSYYYSVLLWLWCYSRSHSKRHGKLQRQ